MLTGWLPGTTLAIQEKTDQAHLDELDLALAELEKILPMVNLAMARLLDLG